MRQTIRSIATTVLAGLILAILYGVFGEFFIELARERGWYDNPTERLARIMIGAHDIATSPQFITTVAVMAGFVGGLWLDWGLRRREGPPISSDDGKRRELAITLDKYYVEGVALRNAIRNKTIVDNTEYIIERKTLVDWSDRALEILNNDLVTVKEISDFRTLNIFTPSRQPGQRPVPPLNKHLEDMWDEKLKRLKIVINRLGI